MWKIALIYIFFVSVDPPLTTEEITDHSTERNPRSMFPTAVEEKESIDIVNKCFLKKASTDFNETDM